MNFVKGQHVLILKSKVSVSLESEAHLVPCQNIFDGAFSHKKSVYYFTKGSILDVWNRSKYNSDSQAAFLLQSKTGVI